MTINQNNDITCYRGEAVVIDFKFSQRSDYYVPFLVSSARLDPVVRLTIGSSKRESTGTISKEFLFPINSTLEDEGGIVLPRFVQTTVEELDTIDDTGYSADPATYLTELKAELILLMTDGYMYQFLLATEVADGESERHFAYLNVDDEVVIDTYHFTLTMTLANEDTRDLTTTNYFYQIDLIDGDGENLQILQTPRKFTVQAVVR